MPRKKSAARKQPSVTSRRQSQIQCWVDVFNASHFGGQIRRLRGPQTLRHVPVKSLIVGPKATVSLTISKPNAMPVVIRFRSRQLVPELAKSLKGATVRHIAVEALQ